MHLGGLRWNSTTATLGTDVATTHDAKRTSRVLWVDRFLTLIRVAFVVVIAVGLLAFIAQQIDPQNPLARWLNPAATGLTAPQFKGLLVTGLAQGAM